MASIRLTLEAFIAGAEPKTTPVNNETANVNPSARRSSAILDRRGRSSGTKRSSVTIPHHASNDPNKPPPKLSSKLSVNNCRMMRARPAPKAVRTAISLYRVVARASVRLATLAQAISSRSEEHTSELQSLRHLVCRLLLEKKNRQN